MADNFVPFIPKRETTVSGDALAQLIHYLMKQAGLSTLRITGRGAEDLRQLIIQARDSETRCDEYRKALSSVLMQLDSKSDWTTEQLRAIVTIAVLKARTNCDLSLGA